MPLECLLDVLVERFELSLAPIGAGHGDDAGAQHPAKLGERANGIEVLDHSVREHRISARSATGRPYDDPCSNSMLVAPAARRLSGWCDLRDLPVDPWYISRYLNLA